MSDEELDLVESDRLIAALSRRFGIACGFIGLVDHGGPGHDSIMFHWDGEHLPLLGAIEVLRKRILDHYHKGMAFRSDL